MPVSRTRKKTRKSKPIRSIARMAKPTREVRIQRQHQNETRSFTQIYQGLIPSPEMMEQYQRIDPELPGRLVKWVEDESSHRRTMERRIVNHAFITNITGSIFGLMAIAMIAALAFYFMINGNPKEGAAIAGTVIVALAIIFVLRKRPSERQPTNKD